MNQFTVRHQIKWVISILIIAIILVTIIVEVFPTLSYTLKDTYDKTGFIRETFLSSVFLIISMISLIKWMFTENTLRDSLKMAIITFLSLMTLLAFEGLFTWPIGVSFSIALLTIPLFHLTEKNKA